MVRVLVTAIISILLYNAISFIYVLFNDHDSLDEYYMSKDMRNISSRIDENLAIRRRVNISELFPDAEEACLSGIDVDPLFRLNENGIHDVDYYFGVFGSLGWNDTATYITVYRRDKKATIIEPKYFRIEGDDGGCAEGVIILRADSEGKLYFEEFEPKDK